MNSDDSRGIIPFECVLSSIDFRLKLDRFSASRAYVISIFNGNNN